MELYKDLAPNIPEIIGIYARTPFTLGVDETYSSSLGLWDPPYHFIPPDINPSILEIPREHESLLTSLATHQYSRFIAAACDRNEIRTNMFGEIGYDGEMEIEVNTRIAAWLCMYQVRKSDIWEEIRMVALQWGARVICTLAEEVALSMEADDVYLNLSERMNLSWQRLTCLVLDL